MTGRAENTRNRILKTAELVFSEKGLYGARVDEISERAEVNKRMIYAYFGSKERLYVAVLEEIYSRMVRWESPLLSRCETEGAEETVRLLIDSSFGFLYENPSFVKLVMWENLNEARYLARSGVRKIKSPSFALLRQALKSGIKEGLFRSDIDLDETVLSINRFCFSYFLNVHTFGMPMQIGFKRREEAEQRADHVADMILKYLK